MLLAGEHFDRDHADQSPLWRVVCRPPRAISLLVPAASLLYQPRNRASGLHQNCTREYEPQACTETVAWMAHVSAGGEGRGLSLKLLLLQRFPAVRTSSMILRHSRVVYGRLFSKAWSGQDRLHVGAPLGRHSLTNGPQGGLTTARGAPDGLLPPRGGRTEADSLK